MLIALAVVIGLLLLRWALDDTETATTSTNEGNGVTETSAPDSSGNTTPVDSSGASTTTTSEVTVVTVPTDQVARPAAEVIVLVSNGTGGSGVAGGVSDKLTADGYISDASNANPTEDSSIFYDEGYAADAREVANIIGATPDLIKQRPDGAFGVPANAVDRAENAHVVVIIGTDTLIPTA